MCQCKYWAECSPRIYFGRSHILTFSWRGSVEPPRALSISVMSAKRAAGASRARTQLAPDPLTHAQLIYAL